MKSRLRNQEWGAERSLVARTVRVRRTPTRQRVFAAAPHPVRNHLGRPSISACLPSRQSGPPFAPLHPVGHGLQLLQLEKRDWSIIQPFTIAVACGCSLPGHQPSPFRRKKAGAVPRQALTHSCPIALGGPPPSRYPDSCFSSCSCKTPSRPGDFGHFRHAFSTSFASYYFIHGHSLPNCQGGTLNDLPALVGQHLSADQPAGTGLGNRKCKAYSAENSASIFGTTFAQPFRNLGDQGTAKGAGRSPGRFSIRSASATEEQ
jgi:hypothetical protein